jgi:hypothetical protein
MYEPSEMRMCVNTAIGMHKWDLLRSILATCSKGELKNLRDWTQHGGVNKMSFLYGNTHLLSTIPEDMKDLLGYVESQPTIYEVMSGNAPYPDQITIEKLMTFGQDTVRDYYNKQHYSPCHCVYITPNNLATCRWLVSIGVDVSILGVCGYIISREDGLESAETLDDILDSLEDYHNEMHSFLKYLHENELDDVGLCVRKNLESFTSDHESVMYWIREFPELKSMKDELLDMCDNIDGSRYVQWLESL